MIVVPESHTDHVSAEVLAFLQERFKDRGGAFVESVELPDHLAAGLTSGLYGPAAGDPPVPDREVFYTPRPGRGWMSRLVPRPPRPTRLCTVVAGPHGDHPCVLYTAHGGPAAPREPGDPALADAEGRRESEEFWARHALSADA